MKSIQAGLILVMTAVGSVCAANAQEYDLAIMNGRVMDPETQYDAVANVGINGGRIVVITEKKIDGKGSDPLKPGGAPAPPSGRAPPPARPAIPRL